MWFSCTHQLKIQAGIDTESCAGCFYYGLLCGLPDIHKCSDNIHMAANPLDKQTADCDSPHNWLMSLFIDLATLCVLCVEVKNGTNGEHFVVTSVHIAFALTSISWLPTHPQCSHPIRVGVVLATPVKTYCI